jgi:hypothetical protein
MNNIEKRWNFDHYDYFETFINLEGETVERIVRCECRLTNAENLEESDAPNWLGDLVPLTENLL